MRFASRNLAAALLPALLAATGARADVMQEALAAHNELRDRHCVPPLQWSAELARTAQNWADRCVWEHSSADLGENLWKGTAGGWSTTEQVRDWYGEIASYDFETGESADGQAVGHFTQVVWRETTHVGCGSAMCDGEEMLVCNYAPRGNFSMMGQEAETYRRNVPPPCR